MVECGTEWGGCACARLKCGEARVAVSAIKCTKLTTRDGKIAYAAGTLSYRGPAGVVCKGRGFNSSMFASGDVNAEMFEPKVPSANTEFVAGEVALR